jgi:prepilin-type N-terminal cleavage/methylation domain-containing protein
MNLSQGFSLIEVLASLALTTLFILALLVHQDQNKQLLNQLVLKAKENQLMNQMECGRAPS